MLPPQFLLLLLLLLPSLILSLETPSSSAITLSLHPPTSPNPITSWLASLAASSLSRAHHLKNPKTTPLSLYPHSYGGYSVTLNLGTPPQPISLLMDTGSDLVWVPCTPNYLCRNCSRPTKNDGINAFIPKFSSSSKLVGCKNPKCSWIHDSQILSSCNREDCPSRKNCSQICPPYAVIYASGSTAGILLSETLNFPNRKKVFNFAVGCSLFSTQQPVGIAGFGRGAPSLPSQLGLKRFSYCMVSHRHDDNAGASSPLVLDGGGRRNLSYTPFLRNPDAEGRSAFSVYYYVSLRKITVGGRPVKVPYRYLSPGTDGNGGTVVDSGTTFTFMTGHVFEPFARELERAAAGSYRRAGVAESQTGLRPCFDISKDLKKEKEEEKIVRLPEVVFHFKGGAEMKLPLANYFSVVGESVVCLTMVSDGFLGGTMTSGPAIILGNFQQQNYAIEFDVDKEKFGFRQQKC